jgi:hypothetical protein
MRGASVGPIKPPKEAYIPFYRANGGRDYGWKLAGQTVDAGAIPVTLFEYCSWPPSPGADATGYSSILVSAVPGKARWGGEFDPINNAEVMDTSCKEMAITYIGGHTGVSYSVKVVVAAGTLTIVDPRALSPGEAKPKNVKS